MFTKSIGHCLIFREIWNVHLPHGMIVHLNSVEYAVKFLAIIPFFCMQAAGERFAVAWSKVWTFSTDAENVDRFY